MESLAATQKREAWVWMIGLPLLYCMTVKEFAIDFNESASLFAREWPKFGALAIFGTVLALVHALEGRQKISKGRVFAIATFIVFAIAPYTEYKVQEQNIFQASERSKDRHIKYLEDQVALQKTEIEALHGQKDMISAQKELLRQQLEEQKGRLIEEVPW
jgi:hypothetical protein